jgi:hypothetical protein
MAEINLDLTYWQAAPSTCKAAVLGYSPTSSWFWRPSAGVGVAVAAAIDRSAPYPDRVTYLTSRPFGGNTPAL